MTFSSPQVYQYLTYANARAAIAARLDDPGMVFWVDSEIKLYLLEAIRTWQALTAFSVVDVTFPVTASTSPWITLNLASSPRVYSLTDFDLYSVILYHLLEPQLKLGAWTGTTQFSLSDLTQALERRQNELLTIGAGNMAQLSPLVLTPGTRTVTLADNVLDVRRARYLPAVQPPGPQTLWRTDEFSASAFTPNYRQQAGRNPRTYMVSNRPPLNVDVGYAPPAAGSLDMLGTIASATPAPPASVPLSLPNDWAWVLKWGMLMDLLNRQGEPQDSPRAQYAAVRYMEGVELFSAAPWLLAALFDNGPVGISSVLERDTFSPEWETKANVRNGIVTAGLDLFSLCPRPTPISGTVGVTMEVVQNAPVPVLDGDFVQVPRDVIDVILDYAVHLAVWKQGGKEMQDSIPLFDRFRTAASLYNKRISNLGLYADTLARQGKRQELLDSRYAGGKLTTPEVVNA